jgi:hypothetical protein
LRCQGRIRRFCRPPSLLGGGGSGGGGASRNPVASGSRRRLHGGCGCAVGCGQAWRPREVPAHGKAHGRPLFCPCRRARRGASVQPSAGLTPNREINSVFFANRPHGSRRGSQGRAAAVRILGAAISALHRIFCRPSLVAMPGDCLPILATSPAQICRINEHSHGKTYIFSASTLSESSFISTLYVILSDFL